MPFRGASPLVEEGTIVKDWGGRLPIALVYPGSYYAGMSSLGLSVIYSLLNAYPNVVAERFFWEGEPNSFLSVESRRPLGDFPVIAFSLSYETGYLALPAILRAGGIPVFASERQTYDPIVIAGGPAVSANPMPVAPLVDGIGIGEGEVLLPGLIPIFIEPLPRLEKLEAISAQEGFYVGQFPPEGPVIRQWVEDLNSFPAHSTVLTPHTELGNLYLIEVERGCGGNCLFCMVRVAFAPMRLRSTGCVLEQVEEGMQYRRRIGLVGPAVSDHPQIEEILSGIVGRGLGVSISSLRAETLNNEVLGLLAAGGSKSLVLAPEAGTSWLRHLIGKRLSDDRLLALAEEASRLGFKRLKLYFMLGLPTEADEDAYAIANLALRCRQACSGKLRITLNLAPFVPKAHTPLEREPMANLDVLRHRLELIRAAVAGYGIEVRGESPAWSQVQGILSRGDASLAPVIVCLPDASLASWRRVAREQALEERFLARWPRDRVLPWAQIQMTQPSTK